MMRKQPTGRLIAIVLLSVILARRGDAQEAPLADHHQHLFSPAVVAAGETMQQITVDDLIAHLDAAGIRRAVVLSLGYILGVPNRTAPDEYDKVKAENDWTSSQVARFPDRLVGFCSVNPLKEYAFDELARCAKDERLRRGLKLHLANSRVDYHNPEHIERLRRLFAAANGYRMAIVVHMRTSISAKIAYGAEEARTFLNEIVPAAPEVPIQVAHLAGAGGYSDPLVDAALGVFVDAIAKGDPRTKQLWFDVTTVASTATAEQRDLLAARIRQLGVGRVLYGSDATAGNNLPPRESWAAFRKLPLSAEEFRTIAGNVPPYMRVADSARANIQARPRVQTTLGPVEGRRDGEVSAFTGIPYAESPVGMRRFRAPEPKRPWTAVFDATKPGPLCPQVRMSGAVAGSEDCLTVNVWSPPNARGLPVMVFLHGGRHMVGGALGGQISFDGARLAEEARVVVFSLEFRFGLLGSLTHPALDVDAGSGRSGNYGMLDQLLGLQWVRENARVFGGDAESVTAFGQSSGSTDIALLLAAPRARGLFHRAILDSIPRGGAVGSRARALEVGQRAAQAANCNGPGAANCLRTVSVEQLLKSAASAGLVFAPHVDGALFPVAPLDAFATGAYAHMPILLGTARDEQAYFRPDVPDAERYAVLMREEFPKVAEQALALYPVSKYGTPKGAFIAAMSDADFTCPTRQLARTLSKAQSEPVYRYLFTHAMERGPDAQLGAFHILSQFFLFGRYASYPYEPSDPERGLSKLLQGLWGRFTSGNPNGSGTPKWEPYEPSRDPVMRLDLHPVLATDLRPDECNFWDRSGS